jgi:hypothetical protein
VNFTHDINPGNGPEVSTVDSGNGFGVHVFWTTVIPDSDVQVNLLTGTAQMHVRNLPELDYYSPEGTGDLASLGPTWQTGNFDSTVSIDVVWNRPVTRVVNVQDAADGFAGIFEENQATVSWSVNSASGFSFTSNPGNFSTSVPEVPGVNGVSAPLNFFAQVAFERNGIFFPQGEKQGSAGILAAAAVAPLAIGSANAVPWSALAGQDSHQVQSAISGPLSAVVSDHGVIAWGQTTQPYSGLSGDDLWAAHPAILHQAFVDLGGNFQWDAFHGPDGPAWMM